MSECSKHGPEAAEELRQILKAGGFSDVATLMEVQRVLKEVETETCNCKEEKSYGETN